MKVMQTNCRILKANLSWIRKKWNSIDAKSFSSVLSFVFTLKPDFRYSS